MRVLALSEKGIDSDDLLPGGRIGGGFRPAWRGRFTGVVVLLEALDILPYFRFALDDFVDLLVEQLAGSVHVLQFQLEPHEFL